jgi:tetratricopeptide (TPR) repeat protein
VSKYLIKLGILTAPILALPALAQISLFYPDWVDNPTFEVEDNFSTSACESVENDDLSATKEKALNKAREQISSYLTGLPSSIEDGTYQAVKGVYLSTSQRVFDQDINKEMFCVLASINYSRIEASLQTGLGIEELEQALSELTPLLNLAAKGIIPNPERVEDFYQNALSYTDANKIDLAFESYTDALLLNPSYWDLHQSFISFTRDHSRTDDALALYKNLKRSRPRDTTISLAEAFLISEDTDRFTSLTQRIIGDEPKCLMCYALIAAQYTYQFGAGMLTQSQESEQAWAFEKLEALGGFSALKSRFLKTQSYNEMYESLNEANDSLNLRRGLAETYGTNKLRLHIVDVYGMSIEQYKAMGAAGQRGMSLLKKPATLDVTIMGLEEALTLRWRIRGQTDYVDSGRPSDAQMASLQAAYAHLPDAIREQQLQQMRSGWEQMDKGFNYITNEPYEKPSLMLRVPGDLPPGEYDIDIIYIDLREKEIGPVSVKLNKAW